MAETKTQSLEVEFKLRKVTEEASRIQEEEEWLNQCISQNLGFSSGRPVAACMIHKFILHWRISEVEKAQFFDQLIENMATSIEEIYMQNCTEEDAENLKTGYWRLVGDGKAPFWEGPDEQTPIGMGTRYLAMAIVNKKQGVPVAFQ